MSAVSYRLAPPMNHICGNDVRHVDPPTTCDVCGAQVHRALVDRNGPHWDTEVLEKDRAGAFHVHRCVPESARPDCR